MDGSSGKIDCLYCAEPISPKAVVCPHCKQNVAIARALSDRVRELEGQLAECQLTDAPVLATGQLAVTDQGATKTSDFVVLTIVNFVAYGVFALWIDKAANSLPAAIGIALLLTPFAAGIWVGVRSQRVLFLRHLLAGFLVMVIGVLPYMIRDWTTGRSRWQQEAIPAAAILFVPGLLSASGSLMGRWLRALRQGRNQQGATRIANRLLRTDARQDREPSKFVPALASLLSAMAPILTFLASVIGAYFTYLAATAGKGIAK
ncbi:MAG TPA: hypothetical protein VF381_12355 [Thermoanaerobaculia bacterium]